MILKPMLIAFVASLDGSNPPEMAADLSQRVVETSTGVFDRAVSRVETPTRQAELTPSSEFSSVKVSVTKLDR